MADGSAERRMSLTALQMVALQQLFFGEAPLLCLVAKNNKQKAIINWRQLQQQKEKSASLAICLQCVIVVVSILVSLSFVIVVAAN